MRNRYWIHLAALLAAALSLGCKVFAPPLSAPERWGMVWHEVAAEHVVLATDLDVEDARELAAEAETTFEALRRAAFRGVPAPRRGLRIVHFSRSEDFHRLAPGTVRGYFDARPLDDPDEEPAVVLRGPRSRLALAHELVHALVARTLPGAPPWLDEGLAEYFETIELREGFAYVGGPPGRGGLSRLLAGAAGIPDAQTLLSMRSDRFFPSGFAFPFVNEARAFANYVGSWGLAGVLVEHPDYRGRFDQLFDARTVEPGKSVYETVFSGVPAARLEVAYRGYVSEPHVRRAIPYRPGATPQLSAREMTPAEIRVLWARLLYSPSRKSNLDDAREHIDRALVLSPRSAEAWFWKGWLQRGTGDLAGAERSIDVAVGLEPDAARYLLGSILVADALEELGPLDERRRAKRGERLARLSTVARSAGALDRVARYELAAGDAKEALAITRRALAAHPRCAMCLFTLISAALGLRKYDTAAFAMDRLIAIFGDAADGSWQALADFYMKRARCAACNASRHPEEGQRRRLERLLEKRRRSRRHDRLHTFHLEDGGPAPPGYGDEPERAAPPGAGGR